MNSIKIKHKQWVFWLIVIHLFLWTILPSLVRPSLPHDTLEGIAWGLQWQWGYDKHPPLTAWLCALFTQGFNATDWPVYLLAQICVVTAFWAIWRLGLRITTPLYSLIGVFSLEGIIYYSRASTKITPDTMQTPLWALMMLVSYLCITEKKMWQWIVLGILGGLALLTKYQAPVMYLTIFAALALTNAGRQSLKDVGPYLAAAVALIINMPHFAWAYHHHFPEVAYALNSTTGNLHHTAHDSFFHKHFLFSVHLFFDQLGAVAGLLIMFIPFYFGERTAIPTGNCTNPNGEFSSSQFNKAFVSIMALGPFVLTLLYSLLSGSDLIHRWCIPYFSALGLWLIILLRPNISVTRFKAFFYLFLTIALLTVFGRYLWLGFVGPYWAHNLRADAYYPTKPIAAWVTNYWHKHYHKKLKYVAGSHYLVSYITAYSPDHPVPLMGWSKDQSPWFKNLNRFKQYGGMLAWRTDHTGGLQLPDEAKKLFPTARLLPRQVFYKLSGAKKIPVYVGVAVVPPPDSN